MKKILSLLLLLLTLFPLNITADDSKAPKMPCDFAGYETKAGGLVAGDEVSVKDAQGNILGEFTVCVDGQYGFLRVAADDPQTENKDGASANEALFFYVNGVEQKASASWQEGSLVRVDLGLPKTEFTITITSPEAESAVTNPITINGKVSNALAEVEVIVNGSSPFTPKVNSDGTFTVANVNLTGGQNVIFASAIDPARNTAETEINVYSGWVMHLKDMPWYKKEKAHYSGAAVCKMILDFLREENELTGKTQDELHNYGHALNLEENSGLLELDAKGVDAVLGHFDQYDIPGNKYDLYTGGGDPYHGYNFGIEVFDPETNEEAFTEYLRNIAHWIGYSVTVDYWSEELLPQPNSPAAVPLYGNYENWVAVNGTVTSANPAPEPRITPEVTVYGFWLTDPAQGGIGRDVYVTASEVGKTYFLRLNSNDEYRGKYLQVAEPPPVPSNAEVEIAPEEVNASTLKLVKIAEDETHRYDVAKVVRLDGGEGISWEEIISPQALTDTDFRDAIEDSIVREFIKVEREDNEGSYYIMPFDKYVRGQFLTYSAVTIDAQTGAFKQASWVEEPVRFVPVSKEKAERLAREYNETAGETTIASKLIWQPQGLSNSPFFPYWKVIINEQTFYVTQDGEVHTP